jgi:hypothetical protein
MPPAAPTSSRKDASRRGLTRRTFLGVGITLGGTALLGVGGLLALQGSAPSVAGLRFLSAQRYRTFARLAEAVFPPGEGFAVSAKDLDLARAFDIFLADEPPWNQEDLSRALDLLEYGPVLFDHRLKTFSALSVEDRLAHFERWMSSDNVVRRQASLAFRKFLSLVFYDQPAVWPQIGYPGPLAVHR